MKRTILLLVLALLSCQGVKPPATASPTPEPYEQYTIDYLRERTYGGGEIELLKVLDDAEALTRYLIRYPSDGLNIYGFINVPKGAGPYPVIIAIHGYVLADSYADMSYESDAYDGLTQAGYIVVHPNLRNYVPSDSGDNLFRVGMAVDVLNLIALLKSGAAPAELVSTAARDRIGLWGHSLGGSIALRVLTVSADVKAAVLYAAISGDEKKNAEILQTVYPDPAFEIEMNTAPEMLDRISPVHHYQYITSAVQLFHGTVDPVVPIRLAEENCEALTKAGVNVNCTYFTEEGHTFRSRVADQFTGMMLSFYEKYLLL
jgi:dipeptidyl aminopeptidase/acylaminoacyl peptidase